MEVGPGEVKNQNEAIFFIFASVAQILAHLGKILVKNEQKWPKTTKIWAIEAKIKNWASFDF